MSIGVRVWVVRCLESILILNIEQAIVQGVLGSGTPAAVSGAQNGDPKGKVRVRCSGYY